MASGSQSISWSVRKPSANDGSVTLPNGARNESAGTAPADLTVTGRLVGG